MSNFWHCSYPKKETIRNNLNTKYQKYFFLKKKWKQFYEAEILIIDNKLFKNQNIIEKFKRLPNTKILILRNTSLTKLPDLPKLKKLYSCNSNLEKLPELPNCTHIDVCFNNLRELRHLPKCKTILCEYNKIESIQNIRKCRKLICNDNKLKTLPSLPNCHIINCSNNLLHHVPYLNKCKLLILKNNPIHKIIINNSCNIQFNGKNTLETLRFSIIKSVLFHNLLKYNFWYKNNFGEAILPQKLLQKLNFLNDSQSNLFLLHTVLKKYFHDFVSSKILLPKDQDFLQSFLSSSSVV